MMLPVMCPDFHPQIVVTIKFLWLARSPVTMKFLEL